MTNRETIKTELGEYVEQLNNVSVGDDLYYAQIFPTCNVYEVLELKVARIFKYNDGKEAYFVGTEKFDKHSYLFGFSNLGKKVFKNRKECLDLVLTEQSRHSEDILRFKTLEKRAEGECK